MQEETLYIMSEKRFELHLGEPWYPTRKLRKTLGMELYCFSVLYIVPLKQTM